MWNQSPNLHDLPELRDRTGVYRSRLEAGQFLADMLRDHLPDRSTVFAIPAGGVPVAAVIAKELSVPIDVAVVSKITPPGNTEVGYGAVAFDGTVRLNEWVLQSFGLTEGQVQQGIALTKEKVCRRGERLRGGRPIADLSGTCAVLVDDGLASGFTMDVAVRAMRRAGSEMIVVAVPTAHIRAVRQLAEAADEVYCPNIRSGSMFAVADAYQAWQDVSEDQAADILDAARAGKDG